MRRLASGIVLLFISANHLAAVDTALAISQYLHTSWTQEPGADLPGIQAIAQTSDGYLWLGTNTGLIRFDGVRFFHWTPRDGEKLPSNDIRALVASPRGLWIGTALGISRLSDGHVKAYPEADRWLGGTVIAMLEDHSGRLWMHGQAPAGRSLGAILPDDSFRVYGQSEGLPAEPVQTIFEDRQHVFWLGTSGGLCRWAPGTQAGCVAPGVNVLCLVDEANGGLLIGDDASRTTMRLSNGGLKSAIAGSGNSPIVGKTMLRDRDGNIWLGTLNEGLVRLRHGRVGRFTRRDGLSSDTVLSLLEDREGDLWIGTTRGIDRFRDPMVAHLDSVNGLSSDLITAVCATREGGIWVGTSGGGLNHVTGAGVTRYGMESGLPGKIVTSLYEEPGGRLWVATAAGLVHSVGDKFVQVRDQGGQLLDQVFTISGQSNGTVALADKKKGLLTVRNGVARPLPVPGQSKEFVYQVQYDRNGILWVGFFQGGIMSLSGKSTHLYTKADGLADGPIRAIHQDAAGDIWVGTGTGLSRFRNGTWTTWTARQRLPEGGVRGIAEDRPRHALWLMTSDGLLTVPMAELDSAGAAARSINFLLYGRNEGVRLTAGGNMVNPPIATTDDGRIWICTLDGVAIVDPARIRRNPVPPPVVIEQMVVDGKPLDLASKNGVGFRGRQLQIAYTALSLMAPERIRFQYRLESLDKDWTDAEQRRTVDYVGLQPGRYRFHVIASNNDGLWNHEGAVQEFAVLPYFYQTWWFAAVCFTSLGLLAWGGDRIRVRRVISRIQLISQERARMMRELHDSLLQGFVGVVYQLEAVVKQFHTAPEASKSRLERAIEQAERALKEARRTMSNMRLPALENSTLPEALSAIGTQLTKGASIAFSLEVRGRVIQLPYDQQASIYIIGREAITNSVNHAKASHIVATLTYTHKEVRLTVDDDGSGFDPEAGAAKVDHWGMRGMRERAASIGAVFTLRSAPGQGTQIELVVHRKG